MNHALTRSIVQSFSITYSYPVIFTSRAFESENPVFANTVLKESVIKFRKLLIVIDSGVLDTIPDLPRRINAYGSGHEGMPRVAGPACILEGGEASKKEMSSVARIHKFISRLKLCRHSLVLAIGGGAVLDAAGFAAATAHRGIPIIRMPTTTLAQNDAGIGVKNAVNALGKKNFAGTFAPPVAVINDFDFLKTLPERELRAGIAEAIKAALIKDRSFFYWLNSERHLLAVFDPPTMQQMVMRCAEIHLSHIRSCGDPFEKSSSRPLDFGHWSAHALEELTNGELGHGDAVAIGIALDALYSRKTGLISAEDLQDIFAVLEQCGFELYHQALESMDIDTALGDFQEHLGGELSVSLINSIGHLTEVRDVDRGLYRKCIEHLATRKGADNVRNTMPAFGRRTAGDVLSGKPRPAA